MNAYPIRVRARLDEPLNRGLWLVKWLLAVPHYLVLALLWIAFTVLTVIAFFAILFTGRYPRPIFEFNLGVLRWTWRVAYYSYGALGTDRYPPFTLGPAPHYPATLEIDYPARLSRGLVLIKWWLLAIPHYLVVGLFTSGSAVTWRGDLPDATGGLLYTLDWGGLSGLLVLIAALIVLFTGRYPRGVFDFVLGMNRWALRVAAYATLMTDAYPPFRLDAGGDDPAGRRLPGEEAGAVPEEEWAGAVPAGGQRQYAGAGASPDLPPAYSSVPPPPHASGSLPPQHHGWSAGAIASILLGSLLVFSGLGTGAVGIGAAVLDSARGPGGFISTDTERAGTPAYALVSEEFEIAGQGVGFLRDAVGRLRIQVTGTGEPLFAGIAPQHEAEEYLGNVAHDRVTHLAFSPGTGGDVRYVHIPGGAPASTPGAQKFWAAQASGPGRQMLSWDIQPGDWAIVIMNADASAAVAADIRVGATLPGLDALVLGLFIATAVLLLIGFGLIVLGIRLAAVTSPPVRTGPPPVVTRTG
ncbi:DUF4389 domain-containing protein [Planobispora takensis]|uniref:DUF4389 domain-containing protein n=1 Tax=Planobispora takensis TaxID=1367882 RepID=A0A8J3T5C7_9ACTN|nr:DUF4389 domain-containing protein [Planobispora takensis]GII06013.1 hypothetical protein Pta02_80210 [Planobispora takensis]